MRHAPGFRAPDQRPDPPGCQGASHHTGCRALGRMPWSDRSNLRARHVQRDAPGAALKRRLNGNPSGGRRRQRDFPACRLRPSQRRPEGHRVAVSDRGSERHAVLAKLDKKLSGHGRIANDTRRASGDFRQVAAAKVHARASTPAEAAYRAANRASFNPGTNDMLASTFHATVDA